MSGGGGVEQRMLAADDASGRRIGLTVVPGGAETGVLVHDEHEFVFVVDGVLQAEVDGVVREIARGESFVIAPEQEHVFTNEGSEEAAMLFAFVGGIESTQGSPWVEPGGSLG